MFRARGVTEGTFAYTSGLQPALGTDGKFQVSRDKVVVGRTLAEDEVDFEFGFLMVPAAGRQSVVRLKFKATRDQIFKAFPAIANLAEKSDDGKVKVNIEGTSTEGFDPSWLRNAVEDPLDEADIEKLLD